MDKQYEAQIGDISLEPDDDVRDQLRPEGQQDYTPQEIEHQRRLSMRHSETYTQPGLSDVALPAGIMPDEALDAGFFSDPFQFDAHPESETILPISSFAEAQQPVNDNEVPKQFPKDKVIRKARMDPNRPINTNTRRLTKFSQTFSRKSLSKDAILTLQQTSELFFEQISSDLKAYTNHSKNKEIIGIKSLYLLLKRQRHVDSVDSLLEVVDETLPLEEVLEIRRNIHKLSK